MLCHSHTVLQVLNYVELFTGSGSPIICSCHCERFLLGGPLHS